MFVGHYGISFAAKSFDKTIPLWLLFIGAQLVDVLWAIFIFTGVEKMRITPGFTATNPFDLYYMPYTHSLVGALLWAGSGFVVYKLIRKSAIFPALLVALTIFSHWVLDLLVHRPDLPLYDETYKMGFGLWNYPVLALASEAILLFGGIYLYLRTTTAASAAGKFGMPVFGAVMLFGQIIVFFVLPPSSPAQTALNALASYIVFAAAAFWLERKRQ